MVNYCCVQGCGRNSRINKHLNYYGLPKERDRQEQWLRAAGRENLLDKMSSSVRFCSLHFPPSQIKKKHLSPDATPSLCLPGSENSENQYADPEKHSGVVCNSCSDPIIGFRYKCIVCTNYDLCQKCEMREVHPEHNMLRISKPIKFKKADSITTKLRGSVKAKAEQGNSDSNSNSDDNIDYMSSDDDSILKLTKVCESGVDLPNSVKRSIRNEVARVLNISHEQGIKEIARQTLKKRAVEGKKARINKKQKTEVNDKDTNYTQDLQELAFADVGDVRFEKVVKCEPVMETTDAVKSGILATEDSSKKEKDDECIDVLSVRTRWRYLSE